MVESSVWSQMSISQDDRSYIFMNNMEVFYNRYFDDSLHNAFSASFSDALTLYSETTENFVAADVSTQVPRFFALVDQMRQAWEVIGNKEK